MDNKTNSKSSDQTVNGSISLWIDTDEQESISDIIKLWKNFSFQVFTGDKILSESKKENTGNEDLFERMMFLYPEKLGGKNYLTLSERQKIVAVLWLQDKWKGVAYLTQVNVDEEYRRRGISKILLRKMFEYLEDKWFSTLKVSSYSFDGLRFLDYNLKDIWKAYPHIDIQCSDY
jgi:ribosomal protein S18 acetylase RimI-like enzyme